MINHARTLLQNMPASWPSDEYVPEDFVPCAPPEIVQRLRTALWGRTPCHQGILRQCMQVLHATELEEHVLAMDPRVTYLPFDERGYGARSANLAITVAKLTNELSVEDEAELFGDVEQEPNKTYYHLWKYHDQLPYKLGGLLLGMITCTERARK
jgi:hypothetical protein